MTKIRHGNRLVNHDDAPLSRERRRPRKVKPIEVGDFLEQLRDDLHARVFRVMEMGGLSAQQRHELVEINLDIDAIVGAAHCEIELP